MGDRGNIVILDGTGKGVCLYSHWHGTELSDVLSTALDRRQRWDDAAYLARIVFCEMLRACDGPPSAALDGELGLGISVYRGSDRISYGDHEDLIVDTRTKRVTRGSESWSFTEYSRSPEPWSE